MIFTETPLKGAFVIELEDHTEVAYQISEFYEAAYSRGVRWNDPVFNIAWPAVDNRIMSERDRTHPDAFLSGSP